MMLRIHGIWALMLALGVAACGGDEGATTDGSADGSGLGGVDAGGELGADVVPDPVFPPCTVSADCAGGQVCRDGGCREACSAADPCVGEQRACDTSTGVCVECVADQDCAGGQRCVTARNRCESFCSSDADCGGGQSCNPVSGACESLECVGDLDCAGGEVCVDGQCESIEPGVCDPGETRCAGNSVETCRADGSGFRAVDCGEETCQETGDGAACVAGGCTPNDVGCIDETTAYLCGADGTTLDEFECGEGRICDAGVCRGQVCTAGDRICDGDSLVVCNEAGSAEVVVPCDDTPACLDEELGCTCFDEACEPRVCVPGSRSCAGTGYRECTPDGLAFRSVVACGEGTECVAGQCIARTCATDGASCQGTVLVTCEAGDTSAVDCATTSRFCREDLFGAACASRVCEPNTSRCGSGQAAVFRCNSDGGEEVRTACGAGQVCSSGACVTRVCSPGSSECRGTDVFTCNETGSGYESTDSCGVGEVCTAGVCEVDSAECRNNSDCGARAASCEGSVLVTYGSGGTCASGTCTYTESRRTCGAGTFCDAANARCGTSSTSGCGSDAECVSRATGLGVDGTGARCDATLGCYFPGFCGPESEVAPTDGDYDPFFSQCRGSSSCTAVVDLAGGIGGGFLFDYRCSPCTTSSDCRAGETCRTGLFDSVASCSSSSGGGFPFP
jgi:hypothetical protein